MDETFTIDFTVYENCISNFDGLKFASLSVIVLALEKR